MNLRIIPASFDSVHARQLNDDVQAEYIRRYGETDVTVIVAADFTPPAGGYFLGYLGDDPVASGAWRSHGDADAEMKRMYVAESARGKGFARAMVARLEADALAAGRSRMILETGDNQPEALGLYAALGYAPVTPFGAYAGIEGARHLGKVLDPALHALRG